MSFIVLKRIGLTFRGIIGLTFMRVGHGFISAGMFFIISLIYNYVKSRKIYYLNGVLKKYFFLSFFCGMCLILKSSAPLSIKFFGELLMFVKGRILLKNYKLIIVFLMCLLGGLISILFYLLIFHGHIKNNRFYFKFKDIKIL